MTQKSEQDTERKRKDMVEFDRILTVFDDGKGHIRTMMPEI